MRRVLLTSSLLFVLASCGGNDPFIIQAKAAQVCQHLENQRFIVPAEVRDAFAQLPPEMQRGFEVSRAFDFDVNASAPAEFKSMLDAHVGLTSITIRAAEGSSDLGFVDEAHVTLQPVAGSTLEQRQFDYVRTEVAPRQVTWNGEAFDVAAYLSSGSLRYLVSLVGTLPEGDVVVNIDACAEATITLDYF